MGILVLEISQPDRLHLRGPCRVTALPQSLTDQQKDAPPAQRAARAPGTDSYSARSWGSPRSPEREASGGIGGGSAPSSARISKRDHGVAGETIGDSLGVGSGGGGGGGGEQARRQEGDPDRTDSSAPSAALEMVSAAAGSEREKVGLLVVSRARIFI